MATNDLDRQIAKLEKRELITEDEVKSLCERAKALLQDEGNVCYVSAPVTICGDIHGQHFDLMELFEVGGRAPFQNYLFLGDFVDRGYYSVETFLLLLALKVRYPNRVTLLRGNHESRSITQVYGFYDECIRKYGSLVVWHACTEVFDLLCLAAMVDNSIFCVHGGLSPTVVSLDGIKGLDRKVEVPQEGPMCDLLWSDPEEIEGWSQSPRGAGYLFGKDVVKQFCEENSVSMVCRAHQLVMEGFKWNFDNLLCTVWSAPNYCYRCGNVAAMMQVDENLDPSFLIFNAAPSELREDPQPNNVDYFL
ncbi:serine/threonine protein phosphatase pp-X isozyme 1 [Salpingoeca rosetta]|uniref:Serine/threonine-protein phosphatase n=1 Tax=Salpingoeca rosetta (strain ATCC 50818 / BSB-021) TaxID=946362 RepID=F2U8U5_SALR5|nr:serine/threonine protein phosphatase pp-X isozyme 1 [Salpingoeca rosetta]EGD73148.1 serine/threonine protein phosphatase pp-X isozyme 1 [Salpingoeca rosetta]|eukprot:XP_004994179.1 serine/threonine protein phosphatase pp-X isozyme 1 [Salpingoeca rosetta]